MYSVPACGCMRRHIKLFRVQLIEEKSGEGDISIAEKPSDVQEGAILGVKNSI